MSAIKHYYNQRETADFLNVSLPTVRSWTQKGVLQPIKLGGRYFYDVEHLQSLLPKNAVL